MHFIKSQTSSLSITKAHNSLQCAGTKKAPNFFMHRWRISDHTHSIISLTKTSGRMCFSGSRTWSGFPTGLNFPRSVFPRRCSHPQLVTEHPSSYLPSFALSFCPSSSFSLSFSSGRRWLLVYVQVLGSGLALRWWRPCCPASPCTGSYKSSRASQQTCRSSTVYTSSSTDPRPSQEPDPPDPPDPPDHHEGAWETNRGNSICTVMLCPGSADQNKWESRFRGHHHHHFHHHLPHFF